MSFDERAKNWDNEDRVKRAKEIMAVIESHYINDNYKSALEFGCGTGLLSFNSNYKFHEYLLLDLSQGMIDEVNKKIKEGNITNIETLCGDVRELKINKKYDVIYTSMVMHHVLPIKETLKSLYNLLNHGGKIIIVDLVKEDGTFHSSIEDFEGYNGFEVEEIKEYLYEAGFNEADGSVFYKGSRIIKNNPYIYELFCVVGSK